MRRKSITSRMMKEFIVESLLILMEGKRYDSISIGEITDKAGVNRSTYYRNFVSKEEIIRFYIGQIMDGYLMEYKNSGLTSFHVYLLTLFKHFAKRKKQLLLIHQNGLSYLLLEVFNDKFDERYRLKDTDTKEQYRLYYHIGGIYNHFMLWFVHGMEETPEQLAEIAISILPKGFKPFLIEE